MVTPDRRRIAVERLQERFGVSQRRACRVVGQHRSTQRRPKAPPDGAEARLREHLRGFARTHPRLGWRTAHTVACREGLVVNAKRTRRLWRDECLKVEDFANITEARAVLEDWRHEYNTYRPHQSRGLTNTEALFGGNSGVPCVSRGQLA